MTTKHILDLAEQLHWTSIRLLRLARAPDGKSGLSQAKLSALSVLVFDGEQTMGALARIERVKPQTMTGLIKGLVEEGLVVRHPDKKDRRVTTLKATPKAKQLIARARKNRMASIVDALGDLTSVETQMLAEATAFLAGRLEGTSDVTYRDVARQSKRTRDAS